MSDPDLNLGIGGGQPPIGGGPSSLDEDEKALKKGNTMVLVVAAGGALLVAGILGAVALSGDDTEPYEAIGRQVNGMKAEHFDGFWSCALPSQRLDALRSDQILRNEIHERARARPGAYAQHIRERCLGKLQEHESGMNNLIAPEDLQPQLDELTTSLGELRAGWNEYLEELGNAESYDEDAVSPQIGKIAKGWYDYRRAYSGVNDAVGERLGQ